MSTRQGRNAKAHLRGLASIIIFAMGLLLIVNTQARGEDLPDLDVTFIERLPRYDFDFPPGGGALYWYDQNRGWPVNGESVKFVAHIKNAGNVETGFFEFCWKIDGRIVKEGTYALLSPSPANQMLDYTEELDWAWESGIHTVEFLVDPKNKIKEICEQNNSIIDRTNALSVGLWVERSRYEYYNQKQYAHSIQYGIESNSWEDWAQRQIREWNRMLDESGIEDRVRLDKIVLVDDDALPLVPGDFYDTNFPNTADKTVDMEWGFPTVDWAGGRFDRIEDHPGRPFWEDPHILEVSLLHEMSHARTIEDLYAINVTLNHNEHLDIRPYLFPLPHWYDHFYYNKGAGIMAGGRPLPPYGEYLQYAWNSIKGLRALYGNCNGTSIPTYPADIPNDMDIRILDRQGNPLQGASVKVYKYDWVFDAVYAKQFHQLPDIKGTADNQGIIDLGQDPFGIRRQGDFTVRDKLLILAETEYGSQKSYSFCEVSDFHLAYWKGNQQYYASPIRTNIISGISPDISITTPMNKGIVWGEVPVGVAVYNPALPVAKVEFYINDTLKYTDFTSPFVWGTKDTGFGIDTYSYANGDYKIKVLALDADGNEIAGDEIDITIGNTGPSIVFASSKITASGAEIHWGTMQPGTSQVEYGLTSQYGCITDRDNNMVQRHQVMLTNLTPYQTYHFRVRSVDEKARETISGDYVFYYSPPYSPEKVDIVTTGIKFYRPRCGETSECEVRRLVAGETVTCKAILTNRGGMDTGVFNVKWYMDGAQVGYGSHANLAPGETSNDNVRYDWTPTKGVHTLRFDADVDNHVKESNERNNSKRRTVHVRASKPN